MTDTPSAAKCGRCGAPGAFLFQQPGPRRDRTDTRVFIACAQHRDDAETAWRAHFRIGERIAPQPQTQRDLFG